MSTRYPLSEIYPGYSSGNVEAPAPGSDTSSSAAAGPSSSYRQRDEFPDPGGQSEDLTENPDIERPPRPDSRSGDPVVDDRTAPDGRQDPDQEMVIRDVSEPEESQPISLCPLCRLACLAGLMRYHRFGLCPRRKTVLISRLYEEDRIRRSLQGLTSPDFLG